MQVEKMSAWSYLAKKAVPVMREILDSYYERGGVILRAIGRQTPAAWHY